MRTDGGAQDDGAARRVRAGLVAWAGLTGASGVALAAIAAHKVESPALAAASTMLVVHAAAAIAVIALNGASARLRLTAAGLMLFAASLFGGDVTFHTLSGSHLFPMAAPTGGSLLIASWIFLSAIGLAALRRV